jgi:PAS domain S-box-containing protein
MLTGHTSAVFWVSQLYQVALAFSIGVMAFVLAESVRHRAQPRAAALAWLAGGVLLWTGGYWAQMLVPGVAAKVLVVGVQYFGVVTTPVAWLLLVLEVTGRRAWFVRRHPSLLCIVPTLGLIALWTNGRHGWFWSSTSVAPAGLFSVLTTTRGPAYWGLTGYDYALFLAGSLLLVAYVRRAWQPYRSQALALILACLAPLSANVFYLARVNLFMGLDPTLLAFTISAVALAYAIFGLSLFDIVPVAHKAVFEGLADPVIVLDAAGRVLDMNPAGQALIGMPLSVALGQPAAHVFRPNLDLAPQLAGALDAGAEVEARTREGQRTFDVRISSLLDGKRRRVGRLIALRDVTERKEAHALLELRVGQRTAELARATARLEALHRLDRAILAAQAPEEIARAALEQVGRLVDAYVGVFAVFDALPGQARLLASQCAGSRAPCPDGLGLDSPFLFSPADDAAACEDTWLVQNPSEQLALLRSWGARSSISMPLRCQGRSLGLMALGRARPGAFCADDLAVMREVSDQLAVGIQQAWLREAQVRHAAELTARVAERTAELRSANERLTELVQIKNKFVSNVSHELRTPLANMVLYLDLLAAGKPEKHAQYLQTVRRETETLRGLIEDLLDLSRLDQGKRQPAPERLDLNGLLASLAQHREALVGASGHMLSLQADEGLPQVKADRKMLEQVFTNLLTNAIHYTPAGGHVGLSTRTCSLDGATWATASVSDDGPGISSEDQQHIFERFYRGEAGRTSHAPGTGLGLPICEEIVRLHAGRITLQSAPGQGSTFTIWLPALPPETAGAVGCLPDGMS